MKPPQRLYRELSLPRWREFKPERGRVVMWGASDQARVNGYILREVGCELAALVDDTPGLMSPWDDVPLFHGWAEFEPWLAEQEASGIGFIVAIGNPFGHVRCRLHDRLVSTGCIATTLVHPTAKICATAEIGPGLQAMPDSMVHNNAAIGRQCILNTRSLVEHDCVLEEGVEIGPGAVLAGRVSVGANTWIGAGASIRPRVRIGRNSIVGAGAVVVSDIPDNVIAVGVPAKPMTSRSTPSARL